MRRIEKHATTYRIAFALTAVAFRAKRKRIDLRPTNLGRLEMFLSTIGDITSIKLNPSFKTDELYEDAVKLHSVFFRRDGLFKKSAFCPTEWDISNITLSSLDLFPPINIDKQEDPEYALYFCRLLQYNYIVGGIARLLPEEQIAYNKVLYAEIFELPPITEEDWKDIDVMFPNRTTEETLQMQLKNALKAEDYLLACQVRNKINELKI